LDVSLLHSARFYDPSESPRRSFHPRADFSRLEDEVHCAEEAGADGCISTSWTATSSITFLSGRVVATVRKHTKLPLDVHLMIEHPDHHVPRFVEADANSITVHVEPESETRCRANLERHPRRWARAGLALNPATPFEAIEPYLEKIDLLLVMTVHPGFAVSRFDLR